MRTVLLLMLLLSTLHVFAKTETVQINTTFDNDIHYDRTIIKGSFSSITPLGLFKFEASKDRGKGKIFSELNIGGFSQVATNPWKNYSGKAYGLKYGLKKEFNSSTLTTGIGVKTYTGGTHCKMNGCKDIKSYGWGIKSKYAQQNGSTFLLDYEHHVFIPKQWHPLTISPLPLVQLTTQKYNHILLTSHTKGFNAELSYHQGYKNDLYSALIPKNKITFNKAMIGFYPKFEIANHPFNIGPSFCTGSIEGSIAEVDLTNCWGSKFFTSLNNIDLEIGYQKYKGNGKKSFTEFNIDESIAMKKLQIDLSSNDWTLSLFTSKQYQTGNFVIFDPTLAFIVRGTQHTNKKTTHEVGISLEKQINKHLNINATYYEINVDGQFYTNPALNETGNKFTLGLSYKI